MIFAKRRLGVLAALATGIVSVAAAAGSVLAATPQTPLDGASIPRFAQPLPMLAIAPQNGTITTVFGNQPLTIRMCEFWAKVLPSGTLAPGVQPKTRVWGYIVGNTCPPNGPDDPARDTYIGPVIVNERGGGSTDVTWVNDLGTTATTQVLAYKYATDQTLHWADPLAPQVDGQSNLCAMMGGVPAPGSYCAENYSGPIPAVPHLHGGEQPAEVDGSPDSWWTSDGLHWGHQYYSFGYTSGTPIPGNYALYKYPNLQEAAPLWFHDHTLGATRLNVYMGLAGANFIYDPSQGLPPNLQPLTEVVPLVLQDRMFDTTGQLYFPADRIDGEVVSPNPEHPYWVPEFVGDTIVINGKAWPYFDVAAKRYRFLFLNGSNARTYELFLVDPVTKAAGPPMWVISTDGGYLDAPVELDPARGDKLVLMPGERYGVIIDFDDPAWRAANPDFSGSLVLKNTGRTPYPKGEPPKGSTLGRLMKFVVGAPPTGGDPSYDPASEIPLRTGDQRIVRLVDSATGTLAPGVFVAKTRALTLNEVLASPSEAEDPDSGESTEYPGGPLEILVNNTKWSGFQPDGTQRPDFTYITANGITAGFSEMPIEGETELWEIINTTADAHPIHLHLIQFQILNRQGYNTSRYEKAYEAAFPGGEYIPAYGPPLDYAPSPASGGTFGGNPDVGPYLQGPPRPPEPDEAGWKDTVITYPGEVTRLAVRWAPNSLPVATPPAALHFPFDPSATDPVLGPYQYNYVWHCHIIDHEDNEMMRPDAVQPNPLAPPPPARPLVKGVTY
jgi:spore coat protein A